MVGSNSLSPNCTSLNVIDGTGKRRASAVPLTFTGWPKGVTPLAQTRTIIRPIDEIEASKALNSAITTKHPTKTNKRDSESPRSLTQAPIIDHSLMCTMINDKQWTKRQAKLYDLFSLKA